MALDITAQPTDLSGVAGVLRLGNNVIPPPPKGAVPYDQADPTHIPPPPKGATPITLESKGELGAARVAGALQGATAGFGDEGLGAFGATADALGVGQLLTGKPDTGTWEENYAKYRDLARRQYSEYRQERPWESLGTTIGGAALTAPLVGLAARGAVGIASPATAAALTAGRAGLAARAAEGATAGGIGGTVAGFGSGEGDLENRALSAGAGGVAGTVLGGALPVIGSTVVSPALNWLGARVGLLNPEQRAAELAGQHIARQAAGATPPNISQAVRQAATQNATAPVPLAIADLNESTRSLAGAVSRRPGEAREILTNFANQRQLGNPVMGQAAGGQWSGLLGDIGQTVSPSVSARDAAEAIINVRSAAAQPLYDQALGVGNITSPGLKELAQIPTMRAALNEGRAMAQQEGNLSSRTPYDPNDSSLPVQAWHYAKMAIDDMIQSARQAGENTKARSLQAMQARLLNELHQATNGAYTTARQTFAGHSALLNALEDGQNILTKAVQPEDIARQVQNLSQGEREMYLAGVAQALRTMVMNTSRQNNAGAPILNVPAISEKLRAAFGSWQDFSRFMSRIGARSDQFRTFAEIMKGSATAPRLAADEALQQGIEQGAPSNAVQAYAQGGRHGVMRWFSDHLNNAGGLNLVSDRVRTSLARMLISDNPQAIRRAAQMIDEATASSARRQLTGRTARTIAGQAAIGGASGAMTPDQKQSIVNEVTPSSAAPAPPGSVPITPANRNWTGAGGPLEGLADTSRGSPAQKQAANAHAQMIVQSQMRAAGLPEWAVQDPAAAWAFLKDNKSTISTNMKAGEMTAQYLQSSGPTNGQAVPRGSAIAKPNSALATQPGLLDVPSDQLVQISRSGRGARLTDNSEFNPIENSRQAIQALGNRNNAQAFNSVMGRGGKSDQEIERSAIRSMLLRRLASTQSPGIRAQLIRQLAANEDVGSYFPDLSIAAQAH